MDESHESHFCWCILWLADPVISTPPRGGQRDFSPLFGLAQSGLHPLLVRVWHGKKDGTQQHAQHAVQD
jgi:hypothetical protein